MGSYRSQWLRRRLAGLWRALLACWVCAWQQGAWRSARLAGLAGLLELGADPGVVWQSQVVEDLQGLLPGLAGGCQVTGGLAGITEAGQQADQHFARQGRRLCGEVPAWMMGAFRCRREVAAVEGWRSVEELIEWGFAHAPVVMANEAHNGLARCIRTREMGVRMIRAAHEAGVRRLAMETLPWPALDTPGPILAIPPAQAGYLTQPDMQRLITAALELGWSLWAYEAVFKAADGTDPAEMRTMEFTNWRDHEQAQNLCRVQAAAPAEPLLVWCGNSHACKEASPEWVPMGWHFRAMSGTDPFVIDQTVTVAFDSRSQPWVQELLATLGETLAAHGGTAGILRDHAPASLNSWPGVDAVVVSTDNTLT